MAYLTLFFFSLIFNSHLHLEEPVPGTAPVESSSLILPVKSVNLYDVFDERLYERYFGHEVQIFELAKKGKAYGQAIWLEREARHIKAKYFAIGDTYERLENWKDYYDTDIIAICNAAASSGGNGQRLKPAGLTIDGGEIVNKEFDDRLDGLVIIEEVGGIRVSDVRNGDFYVKSLSTWLDLRNPIDREILMKWAVEAEATIFQTHLLAWKNKLRLAPLNVEEAEKETERRVLALVKDKSDDLFYVIINVQQQIDFRKVSIDVLEYLSGQKKMDVVAVVSLETSKLDFFFVYDEYGKQLSKFDGKDNREIKRATNLLVFHREF